MSARGAVSGSVRRSRLAAWREQHTWCLGDSLRQFARRPLSSALTIVVMGLALALPLAFYLLLMNVQHLAVALDGSQSISLFLKPSVSADRATALAQRLRGHADVAAVSVRTPQQGLQELAAARGFGSALQALPHNPLPFVLLVEPRVGVGLAGVESLARGLRALPQVDLVQDGRQWRTRLDALVALGRRVALLLAVLLGAAVVLVIGNTIRLDIRSRAEEVLVQRLLGATAAFVRRPYLYEGAWYGLVAGLVAVCLVLLVEAVMAVPVRDLVVSYGGQLHLHGLPWGTLGLGWLIAVALGWLGAVVASSRHLVHPWS